MFYLTLKESGQKQFFENNKKKCCCNFRKICSISYYLSFRQNQNPWWYLNQPQPGIWPKQNFLCWHYHKLFGMYKVCTFAASANKWIFTHASVNSHFFTFGKLSLAGKCRGADASINFTDLTNFNASVTCWLFTLAASAYSSTPS